MQEVIHLKQILAKLGELELHPLLTPRPVNLNEEILKFKKDNKYNPIFQYRPFNFDIYKIQSKLDSIQLEIDAIGFSNFTAEYLSEIVSNLSNIAFLLSNIGNDSGFYNGVKKVYDWNLSINEDIKAHLYKGCVEVGNETIYYAPEIEKEISKTLATYGLNEWSTEIIDTERSIVSVGISAKKVFIGKNSTRTLLGIKKLIAHELESHVLRFENSLRDNLKLVLKGNLPGKIICEEGFAVYSEYVQNVLERKNVDKYLMRCSLAQLESASFADLVEICKNKYQLSNSQAFDTVYRLKRGFCDTSKSGIHLKDSSYYKGFELMYTNLKTREDHLLMISGRVSFNENLLVKLGIITQNNLILPKWLEKLKFD